MNANRRIGRLMVLSAVVGWAASGTALAQTWIGSTAGTLNWLDGANWQGGVAPTGGASTVIDFFPDTVVGPNAGDTVTAFNNLGDPFTLNVLNLRGTTVGTGTAATIVISNDRTGPNSAIGYGLQFDGAGAAINFAPGYGTGAGTTYRVTTPIRFQSDTTLTFSNTGGNLLLNNVFDGAGRLTIVNNAPTRTIQFNGDQSLPGTFNSFYTGNVNLNKGVIELGKRANIFGTNASATQTLTVAAGAQAWLNYGDAAYAQPQHFILNGPANVADGATGTAALRISGLAFGNGAIGGLALASDSVVSISRSAPTTDGSVAARVVNVNQPIVGTGRLTLAGNSMLVVTKTSPTAGVTWDGVAYPMFSGNVDVPTGMGLQLNNQHGVLGNNGGTAALGTQTVNVAAGASIVFNDGNGAYQTYQNVVLNGGGGYRTFANMELLNVNAFGAGTGHQLGRLALAAGDSTMNLSRNGAANAFNGLNVVGSVVGTGNLVKSGLAPLYVSAVSTAITLDGVSYPVFSGNITVNAGWLQLGKNNGILGPNGTNASPGSQGVIVNSGAAARLLPGNAAYSYNQVFVLNGTGYTQTIGTVTTSYAALQMDDVNGFGGNGSSIGGLVLASDATISLNRNAAATAVSGLVNNGVVAGVGALTKNGLAPLYLNRTSTALTIAGVEHAVYSGNVNVNAGTIQFGAASNILGPNGTPATPGTQTVTVANGASVVFNNNNAAYIANQNFVLNGAGYTQTIGAATTSFAALQVNTINFGDHQIGALGVASNATLAASQNATVDVPARGLRINGGLAGTGVLTTSGNAPVYLKAPAAALGALPAFSGTVSVATGSVVVDNADAFGTGGLSLGDGSATLTTGLPKAVTVSQLAFTGTGKLEINDNGLVLNHTGASPAAAIRAILASATPSLVSSLSTTNANVAVGFADAVDLGLANGIWRGVTLDGEAVLIRATLFGDATLDGTVNFDDLLKLASSYNGSDKIWANGDFNYDGTVNFDDLLKLAANYNQTLSGSFAGDWSLAQAAVPEPVAISAATAATASLLARRRRRSVMK